MRYPAVVPHQQQGCCCRLWHTRELLSCCCQVVQRGRASCPAAWWCSFPRCPRCSCSVSTCNSCWMVAMKRERCTSHRRNGRQVPCLVKHTMAQSVEIESSNCITANSAHKIMCCASVIRSVFFIDTLFIVGSCPQIWKSHSFESGSDRIAFCQLMLQVVYTSSASFQFFCTEPATTEALFMISVSSATARSLSRS